MFVKFIFQELFELYSTTTIWFQLLGWELGTTRIGTGWMAVIMCSFMGYMKKPAGTKEKGAGSNGVA